ncbi:hypothetical protein R1flu_024339 [Riccia fluitans]|uniref:Uncharacterized protein n=1 Tax=Riccia fluitans TaxID=41844 RepID=A0ABD1XUM4_9MARC
MLQEFPGSPGVELVSSIVLENERWSAVEEFPAWCSKLRTPDSGCHTLNFPCDFEIVVNQPGFVDFRQVIAGFQSFFFQKQFPGELLKTRQLLTVADCTHECIIRTRKRLQQLFDDQCCPTFVRFQNSADVGNHVRVE